MKTTKQNYVFKVSFLSCYGNGEWIERLTVKQDVDGCRNRPGVIAGNIAAHHLTATERGVRVRFIGTQEDQSKGGKITLDTPKKSEPPIISFEDLEVTLLRK